MKRSLCSLILATLTLIHPLTASSENYVNFIRQYQQGTGVFWDMQNVAPKDSSAALVPLDKSGALFQLWTIQKLGGRDFLLDQKTVGAYLPKAEVKVITGDPYPLIPRTRADQPFAVEITVHDLVSGANLPQAASSVLAEHHLAAYPAGQTSIPVATAISGTPYGSGYITRNGVTRFDLPRSAIVQPVTRKPFGEEHFTVHALSDGSVAQTKIAGGYVQVWPVASGMIEGIAVNQVVRFSAPRLTLNLQDLYPGSYTHLRIRNEDGETVVSDDSKFVLAEEPTETGKLITVSDYGKLMEDDGRYTLELVTQTPFGSDVLHSIPIKVDRTLQVHGTLGGISN
jgi:hypothetical protein